MWICFILFFRLQVGQAMFMIQSLPHFPHSTYRYELEDEVEEVEVVPVLRLYWQNLYLMKEVVPVLRLYWQNLYLMSCTRSRK